MDFWIIRDGEKTGPFPDYEIRSKLEEGELSGTDPAWCDGMTEWLPLERIGTFAGFFERPEEVVVPPPVPRPPPVPVTGRVPVWRRFLARWFDIQLYGAVWWTSMWLCGQDIKALLENDSVLLFYLLPWCLIESVLIQHLATTPGKALLGIRVLNVDGGKLSGGDSVKRAVRVFVSGIGFGFPLLCQLCMAVNWWVTTRMGMTLWDRSGGHVIRYAQPAAWRFVALFLLFFTIFQIQAAILLPAALDKMPPWFRTMYEKQKAEAGLK